MKNLIYFLFGVSVGACGTLIYFRKQIKDEMNKRFGVNSEEELPFVMNDNNNSSNTNESINNIQTANANGDTHGFIGNNQQKMAYNKIVDDIENGVKPMTNIPILPREDNPEVLDDTMKPEFIDNSDGFEYIDLETFQEDNSYEKEQLVYYQGDKILCEENSTIITNPAMLIGTEWEKYTNLYASRTAFIRNKHLRKDYEVYVEDGLYTDEYGPLDYPGED